MKKFNLKKYLFLIPLGVSVVSTTSLISILFLNKENKSDNLFNENFEKEKNENNILENIEIFPTLNKYSLYDHIIIKNQRPIINQNMISQILKEIFNETNVPFGKIEFNYSLLNESKLIITISWISDNNKKTKSYMIWLEK